MLRHRFCVSWACPGSTLAGTTGLSSVPSRQTVIIMDTPSAVQELVAALEAAMDGTFKQGSQAAALPAPGQAASVRDIADKVKVDASKIGVMLGDGATLPPAEVAGLLSTLQSSVVALVLALHAHTHQAGPSLKGDLKTGAASVVDQCVALAQALLPAKDGQPDLAQAVGRVWDSCDKVKKQALDNKGAVFRRLAGALRACKDVAREMKELVQESEEQQAGASGGDASASNAHATAAQPTAEPAAVPGHADDDDEEDQLSVSIYDYETQPLSEAERKVLDAGLQLIEHTVSTIQFLGKAILTAESLSPSAVEGWESCCWHIKTLQRGAEDLGAALNAPQDFDEVSSAAEAIVISLECMLDELPEDGPQVDADLVRSTQAAVEVVKSRLDTLLQPLQAEQ